MLTIDSVTRSMKDDFDIDGTILENINSLAKIISSPVSIHYSTQEKLREERDLIHMI